MKYVYRVAAAAALAAVSLTACGGGSDSGGGKIEGAKDAPAKSKPSASVTPRGDFNLPADMKVDVAADKTGDKKKDAVLAAQADILVAHYQLFTDLDPESPLISRYFAPRIQQNMSSQVKDAKQKNSTVTGTVRYYDRKVKYLTSKAAEISYCEDQSKSFDKNTKTHKVKRTPTTAKDYMAFYSLLEKGKSGEWRVSMFEGKPAAECR